MVPCLLAIKQTLQMIIINAQEPNPNYTPSSAAQVFVTNAALQRQVDLLSARIKKLGG
jgi:hypothetical protein